MPDADIIVVPPDDVGLLVQGAADQRNTTQDGALRDRLADAGAPDDDGLD